MSNVISAQPELISPEQLLLRPLRNTTSIDPPNPLEVDDGIHVEESGTRNEYRVAVHIADAGLLYGHTQVIDAAREQGWTEYNEDDNTKSITILPKYVYKDTLGLDAENDNGVPAVEFSFIFNAVTRRINDIELQQVRVDTETLTYKQHDLRLQSNHSSEQEHLEAVARRKVAKTLLSKPDKSNWLDSGRQSEDLVSYFMYATNKLMAGYIQGLELPWLFRNHSGQAFSSWHNERQRHVLSKITPGSYGLHPIGHNGLGVDEYCHFTSPLRRFPDLANHLNLHAHLGGLEIPYDDSEIEEIGREMTALYIERNPVSFQRAA